MRIVSHMSLCKSRKRRNVVYGAKQHDCFRKENQMDYCESCGQSLEGGDLTLPWEDGDNPYAYVTCPHCRYKNIRYGYGEDDDDE